MKKKIKFKSSSFHSCFLLASLQNVSAPFHFISDYSMDYSSDIEDSMEVVLVPVVEVAHRFHCPNSSCTSSFKQEHLLTQHMKVCKKEEFICPNHDCVKIYKTKITLTRHEKDCGQIFSCSNPGCSKSFNTEHDLSQHLRVCGGDPCPCGYVFHTMNLLVRHQTTCKVSVHLFLFLLAFSISFVHPPALH